MRIITEKPIKDFFEGHPETQSALERWNKIIKTLNFGELKAAFPSAEIYDLKQTDLRTEIGTQSVVSEILNGKRILNARQIRALSKRFHVSPEAFI